MKKWIGAACVLFLAAALGAQTRKNTDKQAAPAKHEVPKVEIPKDAVKMPDGSYHYTDPKGKKWIYRSTPFGVARVEDVPRPEPPPQEIYIKATEDGDRIHFERTTPFGVHKWDRKKSELDEVEKAAWEREKAKAAKQE